MTLDEFIAALTRAREFHGGNLPVIVTGVYGSWSDQLEIKYPQEHPPGVSCIFVVTDICSG